VACTARDRYRLYRTVAQRAAAGSLVICERYPTPENAALAGPSHAQGVGLDAVSALATWVRHQEARWYKLIARPDLELVLRVDPEVAVRRKTDEPEAYVRRRARIMWDTDWSAPRIRVLDAGRPLDTVAADLRARVWEAL
jgi:thymidylate kinase